MSVRFPLKLFREYDGGPLELHIARVTWDRPALIPGRVVSHKLSIKLQLVWKDLWIGAHWQRVGWSQFTLWICLIPCVPLRLKLVRSFGGRFP